MPSPGGLTAYRYGNTQIKYILSKDSKQEKLEQMFYE